MNNFFSPALTTPVDIDLSSATGVGSCALCIYPRHVMIVVLGLQSLHISPIYIIIHDTVFYDDMSCLLPNVLCSNQGSGCFYFTFIL